MGHFVEMRERRAAEARAKWRELVSDQIHSGKSVAAFCREHGLSGWQLYAWKKRLRESAGTKFVEVEVLRGEEAALSGPEPGRAIEVRLKGGRSLVVEAGFDAQHLRALLAVVDTEA